MRPIDLIAPTFALFWGIVTLVLFRRNKSKPELWPRIFGFGAGMYAFSSLMTASILRDPISEFVGYTITNVFLSLPSVIISYLAGRAYARRRENKK
jgi:hypothetical protein